MNKIILCGLLVLAACAEEKKESETVVETGPVVSKILSQQSFYRIKEPSIYMPETISHKLSKTRLSSRVTNQLKTQSWQNPTDNSNDFF